MRFGLKCEEGFLPVYSVGSMKEARALLTMCCSTNFQGEFLARELIHEQTVENLKAFGTRLEKFHEVLIKQGHCDCVPVEDDMPTLPFKIGVRVEVRQWRELHVKNGSHDGKDWGPVCSVASKGAVEYEREAAHKAKRRYRKGFAKVVKVTRYRLVKS